MKALFLGLGDLGWRTMAAALREASNQIPSNRYAHIELTTPIPWVRSKVPSLVRRAVDYSFWTRGSRLDDVLDRMGPIEHVHCFGHLLAVPEVLHRRGVTYSVTLDSTERLNLRDFPVRAAVRGRAANRRWVAAEAEVLAGAEFVCCTSEWARSGVIGEHGIEASKVILNPFPTVGQAFKRVAEPSWLTFVGDNMTRKGGDRLVEWHQAHLSALAELHLVSNDPLGACYADLPGVVWHGGLPNSVVRSEILPRSRVLALPTRYDQSPIALTEAAAAGVPAVASSVAGIPELVVDGQTGFTVSPDDCGGFVDAIGELLVSDDLNHEMGEAAAKHYEANLRTECSIQTLFALVEGVLNRGERP